MSKAPKKDGPARPEPVVRDKAWRLDAIAFYILLLVVAMRPMLGETYYSAEDAMSRAIGGAGGTTPATTAWFDLAIWACGVAAAVAAARDRRRWRWTGIEIGAGLLLVGAVVSSCVASNQRLAINASADWLTGLLLIMILANLCRDRLRISLLLAVLAASGLASAARCVMQVADEFETTRQMYYESKDQFWARQGVPLDDPRVVLYEKRIEAGEASGFFPHSNIEGAWLLLAGFTVLALRGLTLRSRGRAVAMLVLAVPLFGLIPLTGSKGAVAAGALCIGLWLVLTRVQEPLRRHWRLVLGGAWVGVIAAAVAVVVVGDRRGGLPTDSLQFRWNYWQVTREIIDEDMITGVGALNFDRAYLALKPVQYPEEIKDPHNFVLSILAQWGGIGGAGLALVLLGGSYVLARSWGKSTPEEEPAVPEVATLERTGARWALVLVVGFLLLRLWVMRSWLAAPSGAAYVFFDLGFYGLIWVVGFAAMLWLTGGGIDGEWPAGRTACLAGVLGFLLQNLIDLSMLYPGTLTPFAAVAAVLLAAGASQWHTDRDAVGRWGPAVLASLGLVAIVMLVAWPVTRSTFWLAAARRHVDVQAYRSAAAADPLDPTPWVELAQAHVAQSPPGIGMALDALNEALARDPRQISLYRMRASLLEMSYQQTGSMIDLTGAIGAARQVVEMYPNSPEEHVWLADLLVRSGEAAGTTDLIAEAVVHYQEALDLDAARAEGEIRRWPPVRREEIRQRLAALIEPPTTQSAPASVSPS